LFIKDAYNKSYSHVIFIIVLGVSMDLEIWESASVWRGYN